MSEDCIRGSIIYPEHLWRQAVAIMPLSPDARSRTLSKLDMVADT